MRYAHVRSYRHYILSCELCSVNEGIGTLDYTRAQAEVDLQEHNDSLEHRENVKALRGSFNAPTYHEF